MPLTTGDIRSLVIECLRAMPPKSSTNPYLASYLLSEIAKLAKQRQLKCAANNVNAWLDNDRGGTPEISPHLTGPVWEIVWDLIIEGILRPGAEDGEPPNLPYIHLTAYGKDAVKNALTPYDPDGYLKRLADKVPAADPIIIRYIAESAHTLRQHCLLSSTITLGCASEKAFLLLLEAYEDALNPSDKSAFVTAVKDLRSIKLQHIEFKKWYDDKLKARLKKSKNDNDWITELENALMFMFSYFRDVRNDAGHPTGITFSRELVESHLVVFPAYLRLIYDLIEWMKQNAPL